MFKLPEEWFLKIENIAKNEGSEGESRGNRGKT